MIRSKERRARLGALLVVALGALAILALPGVAAAKDRNHDHIPDRWEKRHRLSLKVNQARRDQDSDHLRNLAEFQAGDNPRDDDSDNDGVVDGQENAGTIQSFDPATGKLVIDLFGTDTVSGLVTEQTEIKCEGVDDNGGGEASTSSGEPEPGDDHGGQGEEPGDDNGGDNSGADSSQGQNDDGGSGNCTIADLVPGAVVQEADLQVANGTATFDEVELAHTTG
jgi:hypothetical protein